ncbi:hypothetical protein HU200_013309 [Digitaria exilis]|uniref:Peptidase C14 caspase domain-containing protein n=1 Tax=Digitaria exilis TaxID=1010633 RepID=A0A835FDG2_9POAL|nr:hypothetical protein HU200_013309 [Digitaria exilis]
MEGTTTRTNQKKMLATLVGCNYGGTRYELRGCINDVLAMRDTLVARFAFAPTDITVLTDDGPSSGGVVLPTGANIKRALADMVSRRRAGDVLFFHYSGHGTLVPRRHGHGHGVDEAIVPCDFNLITAADSSTRRRSRSAPPSPTTSTAAASRGRFLPYGAVVGHLSATSGVDASHHVAEHLLALFGDDASAKFHGHHQQEEQRFHDDGGVLLSGCQTDETSADVPAGRTATARRAARSAARCRPCLRRRNRGGGGAEQPGVVRQARKVLAEKGFQQHPCLYCSDANADAPFLCQPLAPGEFRTITAL